MLFVRKLIAALAVVASLAVGQVAVAASYLVDSGWQPQNDTTLTANWFCAVNAVPSVSGVPLGSAPDSVGVLTFPITANPGELVRCVVQAERKSDGQKSVPSVEVSGVAPFPVPGQYQSPTIQLRAGGF